MRSLTFIGMCVILTGEFAFNSLAPEIELDSDNVLTNNIHYVNWMVAYYCSLYAGLALIALESALDVANKVSRYLFVLLLGVWASYCAVDYSLRNLPIKDYLYGIGNRMITHWLLIIVVILIIFISFTIWQKDLRRLLHRL